MNIIYILLFAFINSSPSFLRTSQIIKSDPLEPFHNFSNIYFKFGTSLEPKPEKKEKGGEDALYASKNMIAVADGVGGWLDQGIDPAEYSYNLVDTAKLYFKTLPEQYAKDPSKLAKLTGMTNTYKGSSTLVICTLYQKKLNTTLVGDSGYMIFNVELKNMPNDKGSSFIYDLKFKSEAQQHGYNYPFQFGTGGDDPKKSLISKSHPINAGSVVIVYSDGVSDNLFPHQIRQILNNYIQELKVQTGIQLRDFIPVFDPKELANRIKNEAFKKSLNKTYVSPFSAYSLDFGIMFNGGKSDDISVVVALIDFVPIQTPETVPQ